MILFFFACQHESNPRENRQTQAETDLFISIEAKVADSMPTIIELDIETKQSESIYAEVRRENEVLYTTTNSSGTEHYFALGGFPEATEINIQLHSQNGSSGQFNLETGNLSFHPMVFTEGEGNFNGYISTALVGNKVGIAMWNNQDELVWSKELSDAPTRLNQVHFTSEKLLSYNLLSTDRREAIGEIVTIDLLGNPVKSISTPLQHHAFVAMDDATFAYLAIDVRETVDHGPVVGDALVLTDGNTDTTIFSTWDHFEVNQRPDWDMGFYPQGKDWTHASGLTYNPKTELLTVSLKGIQTVVNIDESGEITHSFGGANQIEPNYPINNPPLVRPHGAKWEDDALLVFHSPEQQSKGAVFKTQPTAGWAEQYDGDVHAEALGDIHRLPDGQVLINYGTAGRFQVFSPDGELEFTVDHAQGSYFSHASWIPNLYSTTRSN